MEYVQEFVKSMRDQKNIWGKGWEDDKKMEIWKNIEMKISQSQYCKGNNNVACIQHS